MCEHKAYPHIVYLDRNRIPLRVNGALVYCFVLLDDSLQPRGRSITKLKGGGGWLEGLSQKPQNIYPKIAKIGDLPVSLSLYLFLCRKVLKSYPLNILMVRSESSKISNLGQIFVFTDNCTPNYPNESFSYPLTIVQINMFEEPQNIFSQPKSQTPNY